MFVHHALFERDYGIVCDSYTFGTDVRAAFGDVAISYSVIVSKIVHAVLAVERMHLERRDVDQRARPDEMIMQRMLTKDMTHILAEKTLDALPKLLNSINVLLRRSPCSVGGIRWPRFKLLNCLLYPVVPRNIRHQVLHGWEGLHGLQNDRFIERQ